jgi:hypothetical protein
LDFETSHYCEAIISVFLVFIFPPKPGKDNLGSYSYSATCSVSGIEGVCVNILSGCCSGAVTSGLRPGSDDV